MLAKIKQISDRAYNFKEALDQAKINQDDVDCFRKNVELQDQVPKSILDKQVIIKIFIYIVRVTFELTIFLNHC